MALYPTGVQAFTEGDVDWVGDNIVVLYLSDSATQDTADQFIADIVADELAIARESLAGKTSVIDGPNSRVVLSANNYTILGVNAGTIGALVLAKNTGSDATSELITFLDVTDLATNGGDVNVNFSAAGILRFNY